MRKFLDEDEQEEEEGVPRLVNEWVREEVSDHERDRRVRQILGALGSAGYVVPSYNPPIDGERFKGKDPQRRGRRVLETNKSSPLHTHLSQSQTDLGDLESGVAPPIYEHNDAE